MLPLMMWNFVEGFDEIKEYYSILSTSSPAVSDLALLSMLMTSCESYDHLLLKPACIRSHIHVVINLHNFVANLSV